jgi:hypothetical protein
MHSETPSYFRSKQIEVFLKVKKFERNMYSNTIIELVEILSYIFITTYRFVALFVQKILENYLKERRGK